jgi:EAL domain-containing protein (putative c-di-GMP-specific phosphodiesterase class I)
MTGSMINQILRPGAIRIEFQPIVHIAGGSLKLYALEALARGPRGTTMERPDILFEYARRKGEETRVDMISVGEALSAAASLPCEPNISINIHGSTLSEVPDFASRFLACARSFGIAPERLLLEIVEHRARWSMNSLRTTLDELRRCGVRIALDDLGVGASNYTMFIDCHPDHLKIDRYVVHGCAGDPYRLAVLKSIVALSRACGAIPIAEGVEREDDLNTVRDLGIDYAQGWLYARSAPPDEIAKTWLIPENNTN